MVSHPKNLCLELNSKRGKKGIATKENKDKKTFVFQ